MVMWVGMLASMVMLLAYRFIMGYYNEKVVRTFFTDHSISKKFQVTPFLP
jgi:hypothetical protein